MWIREAATRTIVDFYAHRKNEGYGLSVKLIRRASMLLRHKSHCQPGDAIMVMATERREIRAALDAYVRAPASLSEETRCLAGVALFDARAKAAAGDALSDAEAKGLKLAKRKKNAVPFDDALTPQQRGLALIQGLPDKVLACDAHRLQLRGVTRVSDLRSRADRAAARDAILCKLANRIRNDRNSWRYERKAAAEAAEVRRKREAEAEAARQDKAREEAAAAAQEAAVGRSTEGGHTHGGPPVKCAEDPVGSKPVQEAAAAAAKAPASGSEPSPEITLKHEAAVPCVGGGGQTERHTVLKAPPCLATANHEPAITPDGHNEPAAELPTVAAEHVLPGKQGARRRRRMTGGDARSAHNAGGMKRQAGTARVGEPCARTTKAARSPHRCSGGGTAAKRRAGAAHVSQAQEKARMPRVTNKRAKLRH